MTIFGLGLILSIPLIEGKTTSLNPTDEVDGVDRKVFKVGEMKYKYSVEVEVTNNHDYCNITTEIGWYITFPIKGIVSFTETKFVKPGESVTINWVNNDTGKVDNIGLEITGYLNTSIFNDQQTDVEVTYTIKVFDDRGDLIQDSEDPDLGGDIGGEVEDETCGSIIIIPLTIMIGLISIIAYLKKRY